MVCMMWEDKNEGILTRLEVSVGDIACQTRCLDICYTLRCVLGVCVQPVRG